MLGQGGETQIFHKYERENYEDSWIYENKGFSL